MVSFDKKTSLTNSGQEVYSGHDVLSHTGRLRRVIVVVFVIMFTSIRYKPM